MNTGVSAIIKAAASTSKRKSGLRILVEIMGLDEALAAFAIHSIRLQPVAK
jgi:hypothetical protein